MNASVEDFQHVSIVGAAAAGLEGQKCENAHSLGITLRGLVTQDLLCPSDTVLHLELQQHPQGVLRQQRECISTAEWETASWERTRVCGLGRHWHVCQGFLGADGARERLPGVAWGG